MTLLVKLSLIDETHQSYNAKVIDLTNTVTTATSQQISIESLVTNSEMVFRLKENTILEFCLPTFSQPKPVVPVITKGEDLMETDLSFLLKEK
jgi:hypothetical protein